MHNFRMPWELRSETRGGQGLKDSRCGGWKGLLLEILPEFRLRIMPTYEYECEKCGKHFDVFQSMNAERLSVCQDEACGGKVKRLIGTGAGLLFKGSGFYITDYRSDSYKAGAKSDSASTGGKSESKPSDSKKSESKKSDSGGGKSSSSGGSGSTKGSS